MGGRSAFGSFISSLIHEANRYSPEQPAESGTFVRGIKTVEARLRDVMPGPNLIDLQERTEAQVVEPGAGRDSRPSSHRFLNATVGR